MAGELDKINEIFRIHDEKKKTEDEEKREKENNASEKTPGETEEKKEPSHAEIMERYRRAKAESLPKPAGTKQARSLRWTGSLSTRTARNSPITPVMR